MQWRAPPPEKKDLGPDKVVDFIPKLLDTFCAILLSDQAQDSDKSRSDRIVRLKNSLAQELCTPYLTGQLRRLKVYFFQLW